MAGGARGASTFWAAPSCTVLSGLVKTSGCGERNIMFRFSSKAISEHAEVPLADAGHLEELVQSWAERQPTHVVETDAGSACYVVSVGVERDALVRNAQLS